jgi:hypothetical protein
MADTGSRSAGSWINKLKQLLISKQLPQRQHALELTVTTHMTPAQMTESIAIDDIYKTCMDKAKRYCRHLKMGEIQFSDITLLPRYQVHFWQLTILRRQGRHIRSRQWQRAKTKALITEPTRQISIPDLFLRLKTSYIAYNIQGCTKGTRLVSALFHGQLRSKTPKPSTARGRITQTS